MSEPASSIQAAVPEAAGSPPGARSERLTLGTISAYSLPVTGVGLVGLVFGMYFVKYSTDVLLVAPAWMGFLMAASRVWDAVSDPVAGYLSDRTRSRWGRRRSWMAIASIPLALTTVMLWAPPAALDGLILVGWIGLALLLFETAQTGFLIPYGALGVELTNDYHERTRLFGYRHIFAAVGTIGSLGAFHVMSTSDTPRSTALFMSIAGSAILTGLILFAAWKVRERSAYQGRGGVNPWRSFFDVVRNPHARLLLIVFGVDTLGAASILMLIPYFAQYVLHEPGLATVMLGLYLLPSLVTTPVWIAVSRRVSKKTLWLGAMTVTTVAFFGQSFITQETRFLAFVLPFVLGVAAGCSSVVVPAITADVVDYDEYLTGERKEGSYLAVWNFTRKCAGAVTPFLAMTLLQLSGYTPNEEQSPETLLVLRALVGAVPAVFFAAGLILFTGFSFNEREYAEVRTELDRRHAAAAAER